MECVWVQSGEEVRCVPVEEDGLFPVDEVASHFGLEAKSLALGALMLFSKSSGKSRLKVEQMIRFSREAGLGDGTKQQPLPIQGKSVEEAQAEAEDAEFAKTPMGQEIARAKAKTHGALRIVKLRRARSDLQFKEWYEDGGGMYKQQIEKHLLKERIPKFLCSVHIVNSTQDALDSSNSTGLATLVKLDGTCITHPDCLVRLVEGDLQKVIMVKFPDGGACYECKLSNRAGCTRAVLEPVEKVRHAADHGCMFVWRPDPFVLLNVFSAFSPSSGIVRGFQVDKQVALFNAVDLQVGSPVMLSGGEMIGIVKNGNFGKLPRQGKKKIKLSCGRVFEACGTSQLTALADRDYPGPEYRAVIETNQLVEFLPLEGKTTLEEWQDEHPLEDFASELPRFDIPWKRPTLTYCTKPGIDLLRELYPNPSDYEKVVSSQKRFRW